MDEFCLRWKGYKSKFLEVLQFLRSEPELCDVTISGDDLSQIPLRAHKAILSAFSTFFRDIFRQQTQQQFQFIYLRGVSHCNLSAVFDLIYNGEVCVLEENLESFLAVVEEFKLKDITYNNIDLEELAIEVKNEDQDINDFTVETSLHKPSKDHLYDVLGLERQFEERKSVELKSIKSLTGLTKVVTDLENPAAVNFLEKINTPTGTDVDPTTIRDTFTPIRDFSGTVCATTEKTGRKTGAERSRLYRQRQMLMEPCYKRKELLRNIKYRKKKLKNETETERALRLHRQVERARKSRFKRKMMNKVSTDEKIIGCPLSNINA